MDVDLAVSLNPNNVSPGLLGFLVVCVLGVLIWFLCQNMGKHLNKLEDEHRADEEATALAEAIPAQATGPGKTAARKPRPGTGKAGRV